MLLFFLLIISVLASNEKENTAAVTDSEPNSLEHSAQNLILVKIEEDKYVKKRSNYFGVTYNQRDAVWCSCRRSKNEKKRFYNGTYKDEETAALASDTMARNLIANGEKHHELNFPEETVDVYPEKSLNYIGVSYNKKQERWRASRRSSNEKKLVSNGAYKDEATAAHASDTIARKLIANGEKGHKINFPDDDTDVYPKETKTSQYIGVLYHRSKAKWLTSRWSKNEKKTFYNGRYKDEETAARASDTLARKLISNGEKDHELNFPYDDTAVNSKEKTSDYIGVSYNKKRATWIVVRRSKRGGNNVFNGSYKDEETAARASDTLARKLIANDEKDHKLNFPDDDTQKQTNKRKRQTDPEKSRK